MSELRITNHALLRCIERYGGFDVEALRDTVREQVLQHRREGQTYVKIEGCYFVVREDENGPFLATVLPEDEAPAKRKGKAKAKRRRNV